jgi:2-polyprenyl-6-methoxyphenol hydroxylase-like FAD-dependent oxidoreductase
MNPGQDTAPVSTGRLVYRLTVSSPKLHADALTRGLVDPPKVTVWAGPGKHILCYDLDKRGVCNVVFTQQDDTPDLKRAPGRQKADIGVLRKGFEGWDEGLTRTLEMAESAVYWPMVRGREVEGWVSEGGRGLLVGDAAHGMLPHM